MPANLNALLRYKTIDECLRNARYGCSINQLIEACSFALSEYKGNYTGVSERTIRDDLRVMKSEMLGFNAPIIINEGKYSYEHDYYSIFNINVKDTELLSEIYGLLINELKVIKNPKLSRILRSLEDVLQKHGEMTIYEQRVSGSLEKSFLIKNAEPIIEYNMSLINWEYIFTAIHEIKINREDYL